jgi:hypothetical protein
VLFSGALAGNFCRRQRLRQKREIGKDFHALVVLCLAKGEVVMV